MRTFFFIILVFILGCSKSASTEDFLQRKSEYYKLYEVLKSNKFDTIKPETLNKLSGIDKSKLDIIHETMVNLKVSKIQKFEDGIFFVVGKSGWWDDGYFRSEVPSDSLVNYTILTHIENAWYRWYQD